MNRTTYVYGQTASDVGFVHFQSNVIVSAISLYNLNKKWGAIS